MRFTEFGSLCLFYTCKYKQPQGFLNAWTFSAQLKLWTVKRRSPKAKHSQKHQILSTFSGSRAPLNGLLSSPAFPVVLWIFLCSLVKTRTQESIEFNRTGPKISLLHLIFIWMKLILYALLDFLCLPAMRRLIHSASAPSLYIYSCVEGVNWARSNQSARMQMKIKKQRTGLWHPLVFHLLHANPRVFLPLFFSSNRLLLIFLMYLYQHQNTATCFLPLQMRKILFSFYPMYFHLLRFFFCVSHSFIVKILFSGS